MKHILTLIFTLISFYSLNAQFDCLTPTTSTSMIYNQDIINGAQGAEKSAVYHIRVYLHYIKATGSNEDITQTEIESIFERLETDFSDFNIKFVGDCNVNYIYDEVPGDQIFTIDNHQDGIDLYLFGPNYICPSGSPGCGKADGIGENTSAFLTGIWTPTGETTYTSIALSHEVGHILNLWHTYHEIEDPQCML